MNNPKIIEYIKNNSFITVDKLMELCLSSEYGYYRLKQNIIGENADFITAPEVSQLFGEIIAIWSILQYQKLGSPPKINIVELGGGNGILIRDIIRNAKLHKNFYKSIRVNILDINPNFIENQKKALKEFEINVVWINDLGKLEQIPTIFIANEFFDTVPVKQYIKSDNLWHERVVRYCDSKLIYDKISIQDELQNKLQVKYLNATQDSIIEESLESKNFINIITSFLKLNLGSALIIDYGYYIEHVSRTCNQFNSTLQALKQHKFCNELDNLGNADLSCHVNFYELSKIVEQHKEIELNSIMTQREFLMKYGITIRAKELYKKLHVDERIILKNQLEKLISFQEMGELYKVMSFFKIN